jgi:Ca2+-binding EF-hand superfamily protein
MLKPIFAKFDADKDGKLSLVEFAAINDLAAIKKDQDKVRNLH